MKRIESRLAKLEKSARQWAALADRARYFELLCSPEIQQLINDPEYIERRRQEAVRRALTQTMEGQRQDAGRRFIGD